MAELPNNDNKKRMALDIFKHFKVQPGAGIPSNSILATCVKNGWQTSDVLEGVELGAALGWFEAGKNDFIILTHAGYKEV